jgi:hypothetical protein
VKGEEVAKVQHVGVKVVAEPVTRAGADVGGWPVFSALKSGHSWLECGYSDKNLSCALLTIEYDGSNSCSLNRCSVNPDRIPT